MASRCEAIRVTAGPGSGVAALHGEGGGWRWWALAVLLTGSFVTIFDLFSVNIAIPSIRAELDAPYAAIELVVAGYGLAYAVLLITGGRLGDIHGRRRIFALGMAGFTATSVLCGLAPGVGFLVAARIAQGAAAALLFPQVFALVRVVFEEEERRRAFAVMGAVLGLAAISGQMLGGFLVAQNLLGLGWRIIFLLNLPVGVIALAACGLLPESRVPTATRLDLAGVLIGALGIALLLLPLTEGREAGWPWWAILCLGLAPVVLAVFAWFESRLAAGGGVPALEIALLRQPTFALGALLVLVFYSTANSFFLAFTLLLQSGLGLDPFTAGSIFAPACAGFSLASFTVPRLIGRIGHAALELGALLYAGAIAAISLALLLLPVPAALILVIPALLLFGIGQGMVMTPLLNLVLGLAAEAQAGMAAGIVSTMQQVGGALGVALAGLLLFGRLVTATATAGSVEHAALYARSFALAMTYNIGAALLSFVLLRVLRRRAAR